jgi:hypothetical protein
MDHQGKASKPPMVCSHCGTQYFVFADDVQCHCGRHLWRVSIVNGRVIGPDYMPESIRTEMQQVFDARLGARIDASMREHDAASREDFYASWEGYEQVLEQMTWPQRSAQAKAEVYELERWARL